MSCYNASRYLREAMESVLGQTCRDYEFIVVNDGSVDDTLRILQAYASKDRRIRILDKANTGLADSLNAGMEIARGEWIARQDADDVALPDRLARQMAFLTRCPSVVLLGTGCTLIDENGTPSRDHQYPARHDALISQMGSGGSPFPHASAMFRRQTAMQLGGYNPRFTRSQDVDLWLRLSEVGKIACMPEPLVKIRKHAANISHHNGGRTSAVLGMAARACHFIRLRRACDPSQEAAVDVWEEFVEWLSYRLEQESCLEIRRKWSSMRQGFHSSAQSGGKLRATLKLAAGLLSSRNACRIVYDKLFGSKLPSRFADEWIRFRADRPQLCRQATTLRH